MTLNFAVRGFGGVKFQALVNLDDCGIIYFSCKKR